MNAHTRLKTDPATPEYTVEDMKTAVLGLVKQHGGGVSFVEVQGLPGATGDEAIYIANNLVVWTGLSKATVQAIAELQSENAIIVKRTHVLVYIADGRVLTLPIAGKHPPKNGYAKPRWMPASIDLGEASKSANEW